MTFELGFEGLVKSNRGGKRAFLLPRENTDHSSLSFHTQLGGNVEMIMPALRTRGGNTHKHLPQDLVWYMVDAR